MFDLTPLFIDFVCRALARVLQSTLLVHGNQNYLSILDGIDLVQCRRVFQTDLSYMFFESNIEMINFPI